MFEFIEQNALVLVLALAALVILLIVIFIAVNVKRTNKWREKDFESNRNAELLKVRIGELEKEAADLHEREKQLPCYYKHHKLEKFYQMDIVVGDVVVELKSVDELNSAHRAQLFNYLRLTKKPIGLLINFGQSSLQGERYGYDEETNECILLDKNMRPAF